MNYRMTALIIVLCVLISNCTAEEPQKTTGDNGVRGAFDNYRSSILNQDGSKAVKYVSKSTIEYYRKIMNATLTGKEEEVRGLSTIDKMMVILLRHRMKVKVLSKMTAENLFIHSVDKGWIGKDSVINSDIGEITESNNKATAVFINYGKKTPLKYQFVKEQEQWKLDLTAVMPISDEAFKQVIESSNLDEDEYIFKILESISGEKLSEDIWQPLIKEG
ncbi:MAG: hypothetical protein D8M57_17560 [Candidatus Scalindua sp. AMX11]|nr:MAG: hypothetical protein DWQ00_10400 [Candidatus Scalindua sp.]NOG82296.1 hypothetical protein [Planctomycetota bacterium]RZV65902.1 MAG: hypothetical protein EX341_17680 [Candidatus Scalindua sp. SCAELEC01]TDE63560.1 MAG: hypothetical protein D8M57_17560 [Candidatus Scalindua sp. AMX11]GJQ60010.1 MAG: hypothetical protein SCALA701_28110 [Candidatus Scalindua sp.]